MSWTLRRFQIVTTWIIVVVWTVFYAVALATSDPLPTPATGVAYLVAPPLLWVLAARLVLGHWWSATGSRMAAMDRRGGCSRPPWRRCPNASAIGGWR